MKALVVGYGSIGARHARLLRDMGLDVCVVSRRAVDWPDCASDIVTGVKTWQPDYVVIASRTHEHHADTDALAGTGFSGKVLLEKPIFEHDRAVPDNAFESLHIAFNLRFHPVLQAMKAALVGARIVSMNIYYGRYLPEWRPSTDYRQGASAKQAEGGGVLRDLSHELDFVTWLGGKWTRLSASGGRFGTLEIDTEDTYTLLIETENCPAAAVQISYLDRTPRRTLVVTTDDFSVSGDLIECSVCIAGGVERFEAGADDTYLAQHHAVLGGDMSTLATPVEARTVSAMIDGAEIASRERIWVSA